MGNALEEPVSSNEPLAIRILKEEHRVFNQLFAEYEVKTTSRTRKVEIVQELALRLDVHAAIEEELLYPMLRDAVDADEIDEAVVEHQAAKTLSDELRELTGTEELNDAKVHVLGEQILHHVREEEEEMFEEAKEAGLDLDELGRAMEARRQELLAEAAEDGETEVD
jgi:predicted RND superfamily exporter protein